MEQLFDVSAIAAEIGHGFGILKAPVALTFRAWDVCVRWEDDDTKAQGPQDQDARMWDVLFVCGTTLQLSIQKFVGEMRHPFSVLAVPRDGASTAAVKAELVAVGDLKTGMLLIDLVRLVPEGGLDW